MKNEELKVYMNNPNLKAAGVPMKFEAWQVEELIKCSQDPVYFASNYVQIVSGDKGLHKFEPYGYQPELLRLVGEKQRIIALQGRQTGKCLSPMVGVTLKNKRTGETLSVPIKQFYDSIKDSDQL